MKRLVFAACIVVAGFGLPAFAQSFDETVAYIQDRCVGTSVPYSDHATVAAMEFSASQSGSLSYEHRIVNFDGSNPSVHRYRVPLSDIEEIYEDPTYNEARIDIVATNAVSYTRSRSSGSSGSSQSSRLIMFCPNRDRIIRALRHLVSLADDDPFAN